MVFQRASSRYDGPTLEADVLDFWRENQVFEKTLANTEGRPLFTFNEGPPTANGRPGIHHVLARTFKDIYPRYKTMRGFHAPRKGGWDTHGLPVEHEIEKELGIFDKQKIESQIGRRAWKASPARSSRSRPAWAWVSRAEGRSPIISLETMRS